MKLLRIIAGLAIIAGLGVAAYVFNPFAEKAKVS